MTAIDWAQLGNGAPAAYQALHESLVSHYARMAQTDPDQARHAIRQHLSGESSPGMVKGFVLFPTLGKDVKARLDELGITPEPPGQQPWFMGQPDREGWRFKPAEQ